MTFTPKQPRAYTCSRMWSDDYESDLTRDVAFNRHSINDGQHVSPFDEARISIGDDEISVRLVQGLNPEFENVLSKAQRATIGIHLEKRDEDARDWEEMLKGGLQTALESQVLVFEVTGVSRACTHQLVRTRQAAFHQQSMRASFYGTQPNFRWPESAWHASEETKDLCQKALVAAHRAYAALCNDEVSYQDARYFLPEGTTNYIMCEYSLREFINVYAYRGCSMFQWEIVSVMRAMRDILVSRYHWLEPYVKISCEKTKGALDSVAQNATAGTVRPEEQFSHHCTFQGWENVEGQCAFSWARETNRSFRSDHHRIERAKEA